MIIPINKIATVGLVELPVLKLVDPNGKNWNSVRRLASLISKQILISNLQGGGFNAQLVNMKDDTYQEKYGEITWKGRKLDKIYVGRKITDLDPHCYDAWGVTINFTQEREIACMVVKHLASGGKPVIVGGSDALAEPHHYLNAGATAVVQDKSGAANWAILDYVLGKKPREPLNGVILADGTQYRKRFPPLSPENWPLPSLDVTKQCLGMEYWRKPFPDQLFPIGSVIADMGCDRKCDFCQTPSYGLGYLRMSPKTALKWFERQKEAGARSVICASDQFLGRVLFKEEGKKEILEIVNGVRDLGIPILYPNGLELQKATIGKGFPHGDLTPDRELVEAVWGWDGQIGCYHAFIPAERPIAGNESYRKLLPWTYHCMMLKAIVEAGTPYITYAVIVGLPEDSHENLLLLEEAIVELYEKLITINPKLMFRVVPFAIRPLPGTPQGENLRKLGLLRFEDPAILGGFWTACADTHYLTYEEVSDWQLRLAKIGQDQVSLIELFS